MFLSRKEVILTKLKKVIGLAFTALVFDAIVLLAFYLNGILG